MLASYVTCDRCGDEVRCSDDLDGSNQLRAEGWAQAWPAAVVPFGSAYQTILRRPGHICPRCLTGSERQLLDAIEEQLEEAGF